LNIDFKKRGAELKSLESEYKCRRSYGDTEDEVDHKCTEAENEVATE
jgi:hypothetical protein